MSLTFYFNSKEEPQRPEDDHLPEELTEEEFKDCLAKNPYVIVTNYEEY